jgi:alpha-1,6-mannosyltransferase
MPAAPIGGVAPAAAEGAVALPQRVPIGRGLSLPRVRVELGPLAGRLALVALVLGTLGLVAFSTGGPSVLVPRSASVFTNWEAGPLHLISGGLHATFGVLDDVFSGFLLVATVAYGVVLASARRLSLRTIVVAVVALHLILLMSPPLQLTDLFNYLGYARLGGLHGLNPYQNVIAQELHDPIYAFTTWRHLHSPYGPLFAAGSYAVGRLPLPLAYWVLKVVTVCASLGFLALVSWCARRLGRDQRLALAFVALNPVFLMYEVGGFHNDFFMLLPSMAAIALVLSGRDRPAGALLMLAVAVKFTAILLLPFLLLGVKTPERRWRLLSGALLAAIPLAVGYLLLFGTAAPNLSDQSSLVTPFSIPNIFVLFFGGGTIMLRVVGLAALGVVAFVLWRYRRDWISGAGWATLALLGGLAWLTPWYIVWVLPLAAIAGSRRLRQAAAVGTLFLLLTFLPALPSSVNRFMLNTSVGHASQARQTLLSQ